MDLTSGDIAPVAAGWHPAVSADGQRLAYLRAVAGPCLADVRQEELVVRDLTTGTERVFAAPRGTYVLVGPAWAPDGTHIAFRLRAVDTSQYPYVLDLRVDDTLGDARRVERIRDGYGWYGYLGDTGAFLGARAAPADHSSPAALVALDGQSGEETAVLVETGFTTIADVASDSSGNHVLFAVTGDGKRNTLYRWSRGDNRPTSLGHAASFSWL